MLKTKSLFLLIALFISSQNVNAQYEADTESIQSTIDALYEVISGDAGVERDWFRFKNLFAEDGRLIPTFTDQDGNIRYLYWTLDEYIKRAGAGLEQNGFWESELSNKIEQFGNIAHVFTTYDSKRTVDGAVIARGINSVQMFNDGSRWHIVTVFWSSENPNHPIPEKYLDN